MQDTVRPETVRVFVGVDRSQALAVKVLEYSIRRHTTLPVEVVPMLDLPVREPKDPRQSQRTGFSFSRFCIPKLAGYQGRAIYMDADMQVFKDIESLWNIPFDGAKVVIQQEVKFEEETTNRLGAPKKRKKQCSVMLLDCGRLDWEIDRIIDGLDEGRYTYEMLFEDLCLLDESEIKYGVPFEWNSLEHFDDSTCLIHYTDMATQPWVSTANPNGEVWFAEVRHMLASGALSWEELQQEIDLGYFRPSLARELRYGHKIPGFLRPLFHRFNAFTDRLRGYVMHKAVYENKRKRLDRIRAYEQSLKAGAASPSELAA